MAASWQTKMDYVFFMYGMAFILLAAVCFVLTRREARGLPWAWLGAFGLIHALSEGGDLLALDLWDSPVFGVLRVGLMTLSFLCLAEFGRAGMGTLRGRTLGRWIFFPLLGAVLIGGLAGIAGFNAACRYSLGFVGGLWAASVFLVHGWRARDDVRSLWTAALFMAAYAVCTGLVVPEAGFYPASALNQTLFLNVFGFPVQLLRALCAVGVTSAIWVYSERRYDRVMASAGLPLRRYHPLYVAALLATILAGGWVLTDRAGNDADRDGIGNFLNRTEVVATMLDPEWVAGLEGSPEDEKGPAYVKKRQLLSSVCDGQSDVRFAYVMALRHGRIVFLIDAQPQRWFDPAGESHSGDEYTEATPKLTALFGGGEGFVEGPVTDRWGTWISALVPLCAPATGKAVAVFGLDISADVWNRDVIRHRINGIGFTLLVLLLTVSYIMALQYSRDTSLRTAASERMHRTLVEGSPNGVLLLDEGGRIARINNAMTTKMGWCDADLTGRFFADLWPESVRAGVDAALAQAQAGHPAYFDAECERVDNGALAAWEVVLNPVVDHDAHVRRVVCVANDVTARHEAKVALRASEEKYHTLFASSADGVFLMGDTILDCNEQVCRMWACSREDVVGHTPLDFSPSLQPGGLDSAAVASEHVDDAIKGTPQVFYWRHRRKDGSSLDTEVSLKAVSVGGQRVLLASVRDITERRKAEERLAKINACFLGLGSDAHDNIDRLTALCGELMDASCAMYNHIEEGRLCSLCQWNAPSDFQFDSAHDGHICNDVIHGNDDEVVVLRDLQQSLYAETDASIRRYGLRTYIGKAVKCGGKATGSLCVLYRRDFEPGKMEFSTVGIVASAIGIEEDRLHALRTLAESEERYRTFANNVPLHLAVTDLNGKFTLWNRYSEIMFGYTAQEAVGQLNMRDLFPVREEALRAMEGAVARGMYDRETTMKRKNNATVPVHLVVVPCKQTGGAITAFFAFAEDIAERKQAEERLRRAKNDAESMNAQLESAIERANRLAFDAEIANIAKSQFLANMSHEIRTPMNAIIGMTGLLLDTTLDAEQREFLDIVRGAAESLLALINDILDFSKVEAGKLDLETLDFDLRSTVEDTMDLLAVKAQDKGLEFACLIHHDVPALLRGDPGRLRQILINLCNNAVKFTHEGEVLVRVTLVAETDARATLHFAVTDTGIGIPQDRIDKLFQSFSQLDASTTRKYGGTGLGLAISKKLSELMGGKIGVESKEGTGSTFWFTLVLDKQPTGARPPERENLELAGQQILIVDDNATNRLVFREQLRSYGCVSDEAASGSEALAKLEEAAARHAPYAAALLDFLMPKMDGAELARAIKNNPAIKDTVLVMVTSRGQRGDAKAAKALGFAGYLAKPVRTAYLRDCLVMALSHTPMDAMPEEAPLVTRHLVLEERRRIRILLAEDNVTNQKVALLILEKLGYRADAVANGKEAVAALSSVPYDLVLMDVEMPVMDGFEATAAIRKLEKDSDRYTPIIAMTAHALSGHREQCLQAGMDDYVAKPVHPENLFEAIERQLAAIGTVGCRLEAVGSETVDCRRVLPPASTLQPTESGETLPIFDRIGLESRLGGDKDLAKEIVAVFMTDFPKQIERLRQALRDSDLSAAHRIAHSIKGAAASIGAERLRAIALQAEEQVRSGAFDTAQALTERMETAFKELETVGFRL